MSFTWCLWSRKSHFISPIHSFLIWKIEIIRSTLQSYWTIQWNYTWKGSWHIGNLLFFPSETYYSLSGNGHHLGNFYKLNSTLSKINLLDSLGYIICICFKSYSKVNARMFFFLLPIINYRITEQKEPSNLAVLNCWNGVEFCVYVHLCKFLGIIAFISAKGVCDQKMLRTARLWGN